MKKTATFGNNRSNRQAEQDKEKKRLVFRTMLKSIKTKHIFDAFLVGTLLRKMKSPTITVAFCRHTTDSLRADLLLQRCINAPTVLYKVPPIFQIVYTGQQNYACTIHILKKISSEKEQEEKNNSKIFVIPPLFITFKRMNEIPY